MKFRIIEDRGNIKVQELKFHEIQDVICSTWKTVKLRHDKLLGEVDRSFPSVEEADLWIHNRVLKNDNIIVIKEVEIAEIMRNE